MFKKIILILLITSNATSLIARDNDSSAWSAFWGAFFGSLLGSSANTVPQQPTINTARPASLRCACGEQSPFKIIIRGCCNAQICKSCLEARRDKAIRNHINLVCNCGTVIENLSMAAQQQALQAYQTQNNQRATAPAIGINDARTMCASDCNSRGEVRLGCKGRHMMCRSCLASRVQTAQKAAAGFQAAVTCPKCGDMLTLSVIRQGL